MEGAEKTPTGPEGRENPFTMEQLTQRVRVLAPYESATLRSIKDFFADLALRGSTMSKDQVLARVRELEDHLLYGHDMQSGGHTFYEWLKDFYVSKGMPIIKPQNVPVTVATQLIASTFKPGRLAMRREACYQMVRLGESEIGSGSGSLASTAPPGRVHNVTRSRAVGLTARGTPAVGRTPRPHPSQPRPTRQTLQYTHNDPDEYDDDFAQEASLRNFDNERLNLTRLEALIRNARKNEFGGSRNENIFDFLTSSRVLLAASKLGKTGGSELYAFA